MGYVTQDKQYTNLFGDYISLYKYIKTSILAPSDKNWSGSVLFNKTKPDQFCMPKNL